MVEVEVAEAAGIKTELNNDMVISEMVACEVICRCI